MISTHTTILDCFQYMDKLSILDITDQITSGYKTVDVPFFLVFLFLTLVHVNLAK